MKPAAQALSRTARYEAWLYAPSSFPGGSRVSPGYGRGPPPSSVSNPARELIEELWGEAKAAIYWYRGGGYHDVGALCGTTVTCWGYTDSQIHKHAKVDISLWNKPR